MVDQRETQPRPKPLDSEDDAWTPADPDPRDAFDETLPADRVGWENAPERDHRSETSAGA
jgi:hypothetical protein